MNVIFVSPNFPRTYWNFCDRLKKNGATVLGIGDAPYDSLSPELKGALTEYYRVDDLGSYDEMFRAVAYYSFHYGKIDWLESNNEFWLAQDARLRTDFHITTGVREGQIDFIKEKHLMKVKYREAGIPTARQHPLADGSFADAKWFAGEVGYPVIVKPDVGVGATDTYKLRSDADLETFYQHLPAVPYVMEEFIDASSICSYDAIVDSHMEPLFESMTVWPPSIMDIVEKQLDLSYYTAASVPEPLRALGRRTVKAFGVKSRFVHLEFFRLREGKPGLGAAGDFVALEVNMRPAGGYTTDMMNFAHSCDVYQIWADMVTADRLIHPLRDEHHFCAYASRRDGKRYRHTHEEILARYGAQIVMQEEMPPMNWPQMGRYMYTAKFPTQAESDAFIRFVQERA